MNIEDEKEKEIVAFHEGGHAIQHGPEHPKIETMMEVLWVHQPFLWDDVGKGRDHRSR